MKKYAKAGDARRLNPAGTTQRTYRNEPKTTPCCRLCLVGLIALILSSLAATLAAAKEYTAKGETFEELKLEKETFTGVNTTALKFEAPAIKLTIECQAESFKGSLVKGGTGSASVELKTCSVPGSKTCTVPNPSSFEVKIELLEPKEKVYAKLSPVSGTTFTTFHVEGELCPFPNPLALTGTVAGEFEEGEKVKQLLTFSPAISTATETKLTLGKNTATLNAILSLELTGANTGEQWAAHGPTTALCGSNAVPTCEPAKIWTKGSAIESAIETGTKAEIELPMVATVKCSASVFNGKLESERAQPVLVQILTLTYGTCDNGCSFSEISTGASLAAVRATPGESGNGTLSIGPIAFRLICTGLIARNCKYEQQNAVLKFEGGANAKIKATAAKLSLIETTTAPCTSEVKWTGTYGVSAVAPLWVMQ